MWDVAGSGILGVCIGLFFGHRLALGRDKRKEFNEATTGLRCKLQSHIGSLERGVVNGHVTATEVSKVVGLIGESRSDKIVRSFNRYQVTLEKCAGRVDEFGLRRPLSPGAKEELLSDANRLYEVVQPR